MTSFLSVPKKIHHALLVVTRLAVSYGEDGSVSLEEIAREEGVSQGYLEAVVAPLRRAEIVGGRRGAGGGYRLLQAPDRLSVADIIAAIEGPMVIMDCLDGGIGCSRADSCANRDVWQTVQRRIMCELEAMTVAEAAGLAKPGKSHKKSFPEHALSRVEWRSRSGVEGHSLKKRKHV